MANYSNRNSIPAFYSYRDSYPALMNLSDADAGRYYKAKYAYSLCGEEMVFEGYEKPDMVSILWTFEQQKMEQDRKRYYLEILSNMYSVWCRDNKDENGEPLYSRASWYDWAKARYRDDDILINAFEYVGITDFVNIKSRSKKIT